MAGVVFYAKFSPAYASSNLDPNDTAYITVGSGSNRALLVGLIFEDGTFDYSTFINVWWDVSGSNQAMTKIGSVVNTTVARNVIFYGLLNPTPGTKTLRIANHGGMALTVSAISFSSVNQTSLAAAFAHFTSALSTTATTNPSVTITSATGNMVACFIGQDLDGGAGITVNETEWFHYDYRGGANYAAGAASKTLSGTLSTAGRWIAIGVDVVAAPAISLVANNLVIIGAKTFGTPVMMVPVVVVASPLAVGHPSFTAPMFAQTCIFDAPTLSAGQPIFSFTPLGQTHVIGANNFADSIPAIGIGGMARAAVMASPPSLAAGNPSFSAAAFKQAHTLTANWFLPAPTLGVGALAQKQDLPAAINLAVANLIIGAANATLGRPLIALNVVLPPPVFAAVTPLQAHAFATNDLTVAQPTLGRPLLLMVLALVAPALAVAPPVFSPTGIDRYDFIPDPIGLAIASPAFTAVSLGELLPPRVWFPCSVERWSYDPAAKWYDEDHDQDEKPVKQAIFTNLNDDIELSVSMGTLVGRTSPGWGPAEPIQVVAPLYLDDRKLLINWYDVDQLRADMIIEIAVREAQIGNESTSRIAAVAALTNAINANTAAITANANAIIVNTNAINANSALLATLARDVESLRQIGVAPVSTWRNLIPRDLMVGKPVLGVPGVV